MELKKKLLGVATDITNTAHQAIEIAKGAPDTVGDAFKTSAEAVTGGVKAGVQKVEDGIQAVSDTVQNTRTRTANAISTAGDVAGTVVGVGGCAMLLGAGGWPLLIFGDLPIKLGAEVANSFDEIAKVVRGGRVQFIGINHTPPSMLLETAIIVLAGPSLVPNGRALAIIYDPHLAGNEPSGCVQLDEEEILRQLHVMSTTRDARQAAYKEAMIALQYAKKDLKIPLDTPDIRFKNGWSPAANPQP